MMHVASRRLAVPVLVVLGLTLSASLASTARAQQPAPERDACAGKRAGDACEVPGGGGGVCADETCYELDYSQGSPPKSTPVACVGCKAGASAGGGSSEGASAGGDAAAPSGGLENAPSPADGDDVPAAKSKCSVDERGGDGPWWLLALAGVWLTRRRTRTNS